MPYSTTQNVWDNLGEDAYTKTRTEIVGTGNDTNRDFSFINDNLISSSVVFYTDGGVYTGGSTINLDDGLVTFDTSIENNKVLTADYNYADIADSWVSSVIDEADAQIDRKTGLSFISSSSEVEYISVEGGEKSFFSRYYPILTLTTVEHNTATAVTDTPVWTTSTEGLGNDYVTQPRDLEVGRINFIDNFPLGGLDRIRLTYDWGYATTPVMVTELSVLLATKRMVDSSIYRSIIKGRDNFTPTRLEEINARIIELVNLYRKQNISKI